MKQSRSFTLIELLVVISIIGLLSSIVLVSMKGTREKARIAKGLEFSQSINNALGADAVGIWRFEEGVGSTVYDYSGYGNNGTLQNFNFTPSSGWTTGIIGNALSFDGVDDYVNFGNDASLRITDKLTFEAWIKFTKLPSESAHVRLFGKKGTGDYFVYLLNTNNKPVFSTWGGWSSAVNTPISDHNWHHLVITYDDSLDKVVFYLDGVLDVERTQTGTITATAAVLAISDTGITFPFNGLIDEVRIYNQALSAFEIQKHYAEGLGKHDNLAVK